VPNAEVEIVVEIRRQGAYRGDGLSAARLLHFGGLYLFGGGAPDSFDEQVMRAFIAHAIDDQPPDPRYFVEDFSLPPLLDDPCGSDREIDRLQTCRNLLCTADEIEMGGSWRIKTLSQSFLIVPGREQGAFDLIQQIVLGSVLLTAKQVAGEPCIAGCIPETKKHWIWQESRLDASALSSSLPRTSKNVPAEFMALPLLA
jgi:hypothetical protein